MFYLVSKVENCKQPSLYHPFKKNHRRLRKKVTFKNPHTYVVSVRYKVAHTKSFTMRVWI